LNLQKKVVRVENMDFTCVTSNCSGLSCVEIENIPHWAVGLCNPIAFHIDRQHAMLLMVPRVYTMGFDLYMLVQPKNMLTSTSLSLPSSKSLDKSSTIVRSSTVPSFVLYLGFWELEKSKRLMAVTAFKHTIIHFHFTALSHKDVKLVLTLCNSIYPLHIF